jgi:hypothetical protein
MTTQRRGHAAQSSSDDSPILWEPEQVMPGQFFGGRSRSQLTGEERMALAMIQLAIEDLRRARRSTSREAIEDGHTAADWVEGVVQRPEYCFEELCQHFDMDADAVRGQMRPRMRGLPSRSSGRPRERRRHRRRGPRSASRLLIQTLRTWVWELHREVAHGCK